MNGISLDILGSGKLGKVKVNFGARVRGCRLNQGLPISEIGIFNINRGEFRSGAEEGRGWMRGHPSAVNKNTPFVT